MLIKTKLLVGLFSSIFLLAVASVAIFCVLRSINIANSERQFVNEIVRETFELGLLRSDYLINHTERARQQMLLKCDSFNKFLSEKRLSQDRYSVLFEDIKTLQEKIHRKFDELAAVNGASGSDQDVAERESRLVGNILVFSQQEVVKAFQLSDLISLDVANRQFRVYLLVVLLVVFMVAVIAFYLLLFYRNVIHPLAELGGVIKKISAGDFSRRVELKKPTKSEIGEVVQSFNKMLDIIKQKQISLIEHDKEIQARQRETEEQKIALANLLEDIEGEKARSEIMALDLQKFKLAVDNAVEQIVILDVVGVVLYANPASVQITEYSQDESVGRRISQLWGRLSGDKFYKDLLNKIKQDGKSFVGEVENIRKNGSHYTSKVYLSPIFDENSVVRFFVNIERDITMEKAVDRAKTEFVSLASHQLRTPLTSISWYVEMLLNSSAGKLKKEQEKYLQKVYGSNKRMIALVSALLDVSRIELGTFAIEPIKIGVEQFINSVIEEMKTVIEKRKIKFSKHFDPNLPSKILLDERLFKIIVQNLLSNAFKYTAPGGCVALSVEKKDRDMLITVSDTGCGIPLNQQNLVYSKLFRADNAKQIDTDGTGLGLYLVKSILDAVGGGIHFDSVENKGTTFVVRLPLSGMRAKEGTKKLE